MRRFLAILICAVLLFTVCGLHHCQGSGCVVCAFLRTRRDADSAAVFFCLALSCTLPQAAMRLIKRIARTAASLFDRKVLLTL